MTNNFDLQYKRTIVDVLTNGDWHETRGLRSKYLFGHSNKINLREGFPASTLRNIYPKSALLEMFGFDLQSYGEVSDEYLSKGLKKVWDNYISADSNGYMPHSYCEHWRSWPVADHRYNIDDRLYLDQLERVVENIRKSPSSRSHVVQTFDPAASYEHGGMPNCGISMVFSSNGNKYLDLQYISRSNDLITGYPGDVVRAAALLSLVAFLTGNQPRYLMMTATNLHIYESAITDARAILSSQPKPLPTLLLDRSIDSLDVDPSQYSLINYEYNKIKLSHNLDLGDLEEYKNV